MVGEQCGFKGHIGIYDDGFQFTHVVFLICVLNMSRC